MVEGNIAEVHPGIAKGVQITAANPPPIDKFDPEFVGARGALQEFVFIQPEDGVQSDDLWDRRLAHADGADRVGFDQFDGESLPQQPGKGRCGDPACGASADDHQFFNAALCHVFAPPVPIPPPGGRKR